MNNLFGSVDNLTMFTHPKFNEKFRFMNNKESINLAKEIFKKFNESNYENIVVIESGTSPLIEIIKKLKEYNKRNFKIIQIKIPRDLDFNLLEWFNTYLTKNELEEIIDVNGNKIKRKDVLEKECKKFSLANFIGNDKFTIYDSINNKKEYDNLTDNFIRILEGTEISNIFNKPFLLFDEYINAGTIIRNFNGMVRLFNNNPEFKLSAFCMFVDNPKDYERITFTLYDNSTELECYRNGAYPFENRIDLINYYYFISKDEFKKVYLSDLLTELKDIEINNLDTFYDKLNQIIDKSNLLEKLKDNLEELQVKNYVGNNDIIRYIFKYLDEKLYDKNNYSDFLDQVFELYAPAWSPMPVINHLDYWNGFEKIKDEIDKVSETIKEDYKDNRFKIIKLALQSLKENYDSWIKEINKELEEI